MWFLSLLRPKPLSHTTNIKQKVEDIKGVNRSRNRKKKPANAMMKRKRTKRQTKDDKTPK
jgi:hypothetical protein